VGLDIQCTQEGIMTNREAELSAQLDSERERGCPLVSCPKIDTVSAQMSDLKSLIAAQGTRSAAEHEETRKAFGNVEELKAQLARSDARLETLNKENIELRGWFDDLQKQVKQDADTMVDGFAGMNAQQRQTEAELVVHRQRLAEYRAAGAEGGRRQAQMWGIGGAVLAALIGAYGTVRAAQTQSAATASVEQAAHQAAIEAVRQLRAGK
jgi:hypothetical protein